MQSQQQNGFGFYRTDRDDDGNKTFNGPHFPYKCIDLGGDNIRDDKDCDK